jgi:SAM-dependent methyltransferase
MINRSKPIQGIRFAVGDFYSFYFEEKYDLILIRDVLEHCGNPKALLGRAADLLSEEGWVYVTYTPYLSPFGGHQHNGTGFFANVPYIQVLPEKLFLWLIRPDGNWYKGARNIMKDLKQIRRTRLTTSIVRRTCREVGLHIDYIRAYFVRPDYRYKFGLPAIALPSLFSAHTFTDIWSTCVEMMLHKGG